MVYKQAQTRKEMRQILALQKKNLPKNLTQSEMLQQGFLTIEHSLDLLWKMNGAFPHTLAMDKEKVVGYALSMTSKFSHEIPMLTSMFQEIEKTFKGKKVIVMGQICISKTHRGKGIFRELYKRMQAYTQSRFDAIITEVDTKNIRSMNAHKAIGFEELRRYQADGREWSLIVLNKKAAP